MPVSDDMALLQPIAYPIDIRLALPPAAAVLMEVDTSSRSQLRQ